MPEMRRLTRPQVSALGRHGDFLKLWAGQTVSLFGSRITLLALPLAAILTLHASPFQMGILAATGSAGSLFFGLLAGVWVDRVRRRPVMIVANLGRAVVLFSIPAAAWLGALHLVHLYVVSFLAATLAVFFNIAYRSYLPSLVDRSQLVEGNSRLAMSASAAQIAGPGLGGALVQLFTAPVAIVADAISFLLSALSLISIRTPEPIPPAPAAPNLRREVAEGVRAVWRDPLLRSLAAASATFDLFDSVLFAVYVLYMSRTLHLSAATIGLIFGLAGVGGLLAALAVAPLTARLGLGRAIRWGMIFLALGETLIAAARGPQAVAVLVLLAAEGTVELGEGLYSINVGSLQQAVIPEALRGRVIATIDLVRFGAAPLGALVGGALGQTVGLRQTVLIAGVGTLLSLLWIVRSPVYKLRDMPAAPPSGVRES